VLFVSLRPPPLTSPPFPYTTLFRSRFWVAEHHAVPGIASGSPAVLLAAIGARTARIRLGSGGVMLPNHRPLPVAEQFRMLAALRSEEHTSELQSRFDLVCRLLLEKK